MASLVRIGVSRLGKKLLFTKSEVRSITSKAVRSKDLDRPLKPKPWNYKEKSYTILNYWIDRTTSRLDENSKIVVVEGPAAVGKTKFAKTLAEELDMLYMPEANLDMMYINPYGFDTKQLDDQLPESCRSFDIKNFLLTPKHQNATVFQFKQYLVKYSQYIDALAHLLSTGQGIVLDKSCYSDFVFVEAMRSQGYLSKPAYDTYYEIRANTIPELLKPHLVIYLDIPVNMVQENIKKRGYTCEKNSEVLTTDYLCAMEHAYKNKYLKEVSKHSELLVYDWSEGGDVEIIVEDIEDINFDDLDVQDPKMKDWRHHTEEDWGVLRNKYTNRKDWVLANFNVPVFHLPELMITQDEAKVYHDLMNDSPGQLYDVGFNAAMGDRFLFKNSRRNMDTLPLIERNLQ